MSNHKINNLNPSVAHYLYGLKIHGKTETYETIVLMLLNDRYQKEINILIQDGMKNTNIKDGRITLKFSSSHEYIDAISSVCGSKYLIDNYSEPEIRRKKIIATNVITEIITSAVLNTLNTDVKILASTPTVTYPGITSEIVENENSNQITLSFDSETPINDVVKYMKEMFGMKNKPKKKKLTLGRSYRILQSYEEIKSNEENYRDEQYEYIEQLVSREMKQKYGEDISTDTVTKSLQRIRKIQKDINDSPKDK